MIYYIHFIEELNEYCMWKTRISLKEYKSFNCFDELVEFYKTNPKYPTLAYLIVGEFHLDARETREVFSFADESALLKLMAPSLKVRWKITNCLI